MYHIIWSYDETLVKRGLKRGLAFYESTLYDSTSLWSISYGRELIFQTLLEYSKATD